MTIQDTGTVARDGEVAVHILPVDGLPEVQPGDDLATMLGDALASSAGGLAEGDIVVVTHKVVSKAEGRLVDLATVTPSPFARKWAEEWGKDARQVEVVLGQARKIVRMHRGLIIAETHHGLTCANAGVDASNAGEETVVLLPEDPDGSAERLRRRADTPLLTGCGGGRSADRGHHHRFVRPGLAQWHREYRHRGCRYQPVRGLSGRV